MPDTFQFTSVTSYDSNGTPLLSGFVSTNREVNGVTHKYSSRVEQLSKNTIGDIALRASKYAHGNAISAALEAAGYYLDGLIWKVRERNTVGNCSAAPGGTGNINQSACEAMIRANALDDRYDYRSVVSVSLDATVTRDDIHAYYVGYVVNVVNRDGDSGTLTGQSWLSGVTEFTVTPEKAYDALTPAILADFDAWSGYANDPATDTLYAGIPEFTVLITAIEDALIDSGNPLPETVVKTFENTPPEHPPIPPGPLSPECLEAIETATQGLIAQTTGKYTLQTDPYLSEDWRDIR